VSAARTWCNPVWPGSFPDPFVLEHQGEYWGYCTGVWQDGRCFGILHSPDLIHWEPRPGALAPLPGNHPCYWAPEVAYGHGRFYLYYSVGNEETMEIRVAVAGHPAGPFTDSGRRLTSEPFAIDPHVFTARDGSRWLFYAADFLDRPHIGTGTVRDRLLDPFTLAGAPQPVTLPRYDWQVYHPCRPEKGNVRWHTVEGPFVLERKGVLYQMFSGGNWQNPTYGVSYATSHDITAPGEWEQAADGERVLPILRTLRGPDGDVIGPGHNSVVRGPDGRQLYCVYHRWSPGLDNHAGARVLCIDRLDWAGERMFILGPTTTPQRAPADAGAPGWEELFEEDGDPTDRGWERTGDGKARVSGGRLHLDPGQEIVRIARGPAFAAYELVVNVRVEGEGNALIQPALADGIDEEGPELRYRTAIDQQLRFVKEGDRVEISCEGSPLGSLSAPSGPTRIGLGAEGGVVTFEMVRVTALRA
jgi:beta-xylosidase